VGSRTDRNVPLVRTPARGLTARKSRPEQYCSDRLADPLRAPAQEPAFPDGRHDANKNLPCCSQNNHRHLIDHGVTSGLTWPKLCTKSSSTRAHITLTQVVSVAHSGY